MLNKLINDTGAGMVFIEREPEFSYMFSNTINEQQKPLFEELNMLDLKSDENSVITFSVPAKTPRKHLKQQTPLAS
jgi:hypothetical protein